MSRRALTWTMGAVPLAAMVALVIAIKAVPAHGQPEDPQSTCVPGPQKWAVPSDLVLGESSQVTLAMTHTCAAEKLPVDLVFVVDVSNSMMRGSAGVDPGDPGPGPGPGRTPATPRTPGPPGTPEPPIPPTPGAGAGREPVYDPCNAARGGGAGGGRPSPTPGGGGIGPPGRTPPTPVGGPTPGLPTRTPRSEPPGSGPNPALPEPLGTQNLIADVQEAIRDFLDQPAVQEDLNSGRLRTGLVSFSDVGRRVVRLSDNPSAVSSGLSRLRGGGSSQLALGIRVAAQDLQGASGGGGQDDRVRLLMVYTDGQFCARDLRSADPDFETIAIGVGPNLNRNLLQQLASEREYALELRELREQVRIYTTLLPGTRTVMMDTMTIVEVLSEDVAYVPDSAVPPPSEFVTRTLKWTFAPPTSPLTITYGVEPLVAGQVPVNEDAEATWIDTSDLIGAVQIPNVVLNVALPTPTVTPTPTNTATATATSTPEPEPRYLPFLSNRWPPAPTPTPPCVPSEQTVDVAIVIDTSGSMLDPTHVGGQSKLDAAIDGAKGLVGLLKFPPDGSLDQAAVISFNTEAETLADLTGDIGTVQAALDELRLRQDTGTRIDKGLEHAFAQLAGPAHRSGNNRAVVLLTDGRQSVGGTPADVLARADALKALGVTVWTVALGTDVDTDLLLAAASTPGHFRHAATTEDLQIIYEEIARVVPCR